MAIKQRPFRIMVDIETTGTTPGCRIWQIGGIESLGSEFLVTANMSLEQGEQGWRDDGKTIDLNRFEKTLYISKSRSGKGATHAELIN